MKTEKNILIAFLLNMFFSIFELIGGILTHSVAIISDAIHDFGDGITIGISYFLEKKSKKSADNNYTFGYRRYSILGAVITNSILIIGSIIVIINALNRIINPSIIKPSAPSTDGYELATIIRVHRKRITDRPEYTIGNQSFEYSRNVLGVVLSVTII